MMNAGDIAFPHLGIYLENVPRSFSVFGFEIAFYGLIIGIGVLAGILMAVHQAKVTGENPDTIWDFAIYAVIFSVIGARIYYVVFAWDYYKDNLLSIFNTRNGGMAIYGGVIGAFLTLLIYCRIKKINPFRLGDLCVPGLILGQIIGRWANFINREAFGGLTDLPWRMRLWVTSSQYIEVHPTFLYESLWNLVGLGLLLFVISKGRRFDGENTWFYFLWYGLGRFWIEGLRTDSLYLFDWTFMGQPIRVSQALSLVLAIVAALMLFYNIRIKKRTAEGLLVNRLAREQLTADTEAVSPLMEEPETAEETAEATLGESEEPKS